MCVLLTPNSTQIGQEVWKVRVEIRYAFIQSGASIAADFHETDHHVIHFVEILRTEIYPHRAKILNKHRRNFIYALKQCKDFTVPIFTKTRNCWAALDLVSVAEFYKNLSIKLESMGRISLPCYAKDNWPPPSQLSWNLCRIDNVLQITPIPSFMEIRQSQLSRNLCRIDNVLQITPIPSFMEIRQTI
jgi:hypothetical protein